MIVRDDETEDRDDRLQDRGEARRRALFAPEEQPVVERESEQAGDEDEQPVAACARPLNASDDDDARQDRGGDDEAYAGEADRRQVFKAELDEEPSRTPDQTEHKPDDNRRVHA